MRKGPIGVFDSGIGGLTVVSALRRRLPGERIVYLGDSARVPYGTKSPATIQRYSVQNARFLMGHGVKLVVVACNTASAWAMDSLRAAFRIPAIGVIEPGCEAAVRCSGNGVIGVIGTAATIGSGAYPAAIKRLRPDAWVVSKPCPLFVPLVEEGWLDHAVTRQVISEYLGPVVESGIDCLVLGCTHYPLLKPAISAFVGGGVTLVDSAETVAEAVERKLVELDLRGDGGRESDLFYLTDASPTFRQALRLFLGGRDEQPTVVDIDHRGSEN